VPTQPAQQSRPVLVDTGAGALAESVDRAIDDWQPTHDERRIDDIGWAKDLRDARRLAKEYQRPIFLLVHGGNLATGRCCAGSAHARASALSNERVIDLLNHWYIPVAIANQDFRKEGAAAAEERAEYQRIRAAANREGVLGGESWVYVLDADGRPVDSLHGCTAAVAHHMLDLLEFYARDLDAKEGPAVIAPVPLSRPPQAEAGALVLHLTARYLKRQGNELVPIQTALGTDKAGGWHDYAVENWLVLARDEWSRLLPSATPTLGASWTLPETVCERLLLNFYPQTEGNDLSRNRIDRGSLRATVVSLRGDTVRARLEGTLRMKHPFVYPIPDDRYVDATIAGYLDFDLSRQRIRALRLYTPRATYGADPFGVAVRSLP
jgi:hypothetical protein